jgi:hypothetical protein
MYILAATGGPSFLVHTIVAIGALVVGFAALLLKKLRRAKAN